MSKARSRACGSARSCIQPCSSHSRMAPVSSRTDLAHPSIVRKAVRLFLHHQHRNPSSRLARRGMRRPFRLPLTQGRDSELWEPGPFHLFCGSCAPLASLAPRPHVLHQRDGAEMTVQRSP
jgi:hypothetical protein